MRTLLATLLALAFLPATHAQIGLPEPKLTADKPTQDAVDLPAGASTMVHLTAHRACPTPAGVLPAAHLRVKAAAPPGLGAQGPAEVPLPQQVCATDPVATVTFAYNVSATALAKPGRHVVTFVLHVPGDFTTPDSNKAFVEAGFLVPEPVAPAGESPAQGAIQDTMQDATQAAPSAGIGLALAALALAAARRRA